MTTAFPLCWPHGWPRTPSHRQYSGAKFGRTTFAKARDSLLDEVRRLHAAHIVVSTNHPVDRNGIPREGTRIADQGIAVYFMLNGKHLAMACDRFSNAAANMRSLALGIEHLRGLERHGGGVMMERAFSGFAALPAPKQHWDILGIPAARRPTTSNEHSAAWR
jgi:hypothetical protein